LVLLKILPAFLFISFSAGELGRIGIGNGVSVGFLDVSISLFTLFWLLKHKKRKYELTKPIMAFVILAFFSLVINLTNYTQSQLLVSSLYLIRWVLYSTVYFIFAGLDPDIKKTIDRYILGSGFIILLAGFFQFILYPSLKNLYYLGWDEHMYRLFGTFLDPNFTGVVLVLYFIFVFVKKKDLFSNELFSYALLFITFLGIVLTYSRGALLMFAVSVVTYAALQKNCKIIGATAVLFVVLFAVLSPRFYLENTNLLRTVSTKERLATAQKALSIWQKNPLGVGFDTYRYAREKYGEKDLAEFGLSHSGAGVDNSLIFVLVTAGIQGLIAYLYLLWKMLRLGLRNIQRNKYGLILVVSMTGLIVNSLTINSLFYSFIMVWMWMVAGLTDYNSNE
jgi:O-antigen ligase